MKPNPISRKRKLYVFLWITIAFPLQVLTQPAGDDTFPKRKYARQFLDEVRPVPAYPDQTSGQASPRGPAHYAGDRRPIRTITLRD